MLFRVGILVLDLLDLSLDVWIFDLCALTVCKNLFSFFKPPFADQPSWTLGQPWDCAV